MAFLISYDRRGGMRGEEKKTTKKKKRRESERTHFPHHLRIELKDRTAGVDLNDVNRPAHITL